MIKLFSANLPSLNQLKNGVYKAYWYASTLELEDSRKFSTYPLGVRHSRKFAQLQFYQVENGKLTQL